MKKYIAAVAAMLMLSFASQARIFKFIYIVHDNKTDIAALTRFLEDEVGDLEYEEEDEASKNRTIVYLSSDDKPIIANMDSGNAANASMSQSIIEELNNRTYHFANTDFDKTQTIDLLAANDFMDSEGKLNADLVKFEFYVTPDTWNVASNYIASIYYALGIDRFYDKKSPDYSHSLSFKIYFPSLDDMRGCRGKDDKFFGEENPNNINTLLTVADFVGTYQK